MTATFETDRGPDAWANMFAFLSVPVLVLERSGRVAYCNAAYARVFQWSHDEIISRPLDIIPPCRQSVLETIWHALDGQNKVQGFRTWWRNKSGNRVDVVMDAMALGACAGRPDVVVLALSDIRRRLSHARGRHLLLRMAETLGRNGPVQPLDRVMRLIRAFLKVEGVALILPDQETGHLFTALVQFADSAMAARFKKIRFSLDHSGLGEVCRSGKALMAETASGTGSFGAALGAWPPDVRNLLVAALPVQSRIIGLLALINKRHSRFDGQDRDILTVAAAMLAPAVEKTFAGADEMPERFHAAGTSGEGLIQYLSHELKTPLAVLSACIHLLERGPASLDDPKRLAIRQRIERNLQRLLDMEYALEDILKPHIVNNKRNR